ncbi:MAG: LemA family protein [Bacteroidetes bacterium]|jgi:LemA protein|nr:LemA family protein [Bacteroidota bacterium]
MGKGSIIAIALVAVLAMFGFYGCNKRNSFVEMREKVKAQWHQVENQYQRRLDLIPNIVASVEAEANFEKSTLKEVTEARASATQVKVDVDNLDEASMNKYKAAQGQLSAALGRLLMVTENYPNLKSSQAFSELRVELEGCENRIATERMNYNNAAREYNTEIQKFPASLFAGGFEKSAYFEAEAGAEKAPKVKFDIK